MLRGLVLIVFLIGQVSACNVQNVDPGNLWKVVKSKDAGFKASFPCDAVSTKKLFQEVPKLAHLYSFECEYEGINFSVSLPERFGEFDPIQVGQDLDGVEETLLSMIGKNARIISTNRIFQSYSLREFEVDSGETFQKSE